MPEAKYTDAEIFEWFDAGWSNNRIKSEKQLGMARIKKLRALYESDRPSKPIVITALPDPAPAPDFRGSYENYIDPRNTGRASENYTIAVLDLCARAEALARKYAGTKKRWHAHSTEPDYLAYMELLALIAQIREGQV